MMLFPEEYWFLWYRTDNNDNNNHSAHGKATGSSDTRCGGSYSYHDSKNAKKFQKNLKKEKGTKGDKKFKWMFGNTGGFGATPSPVSSPTTHYDAYEYAHEDSQLCDELVGRVNDPARTPAPFRSPWSDPLPTAPSSSSSGGDDNNNDNNNNDNSNPPQMPPSRSPTKTPKARPESNPYPTAPSPWDDGDDDGTPIASASASASATPTEAPIVFGNEAPNGTGGSGSDPGNADSNVDAFCQNIRDQNHASILAQQETGTTGPSFLFSVPVSVLHDEELAPYDLVLYYLDLLNAPVALAVSGCPTAPGGARRRVAIARDPSRSLQQDIVVQYVELESWQQIDSAPGDSEDSTCSPSEGEELSCGIFRSRLIVFLPRDDSAGGLRRGDVEDLLVGRIDAALRENRNVVTRYPGVRSLEVGSIEPLYIAQDGDEDDEVGASSAESSSTLASSNSRGILLSKHATAIIGSVSACLGGLFLGVIFIVWWRKADQRPYDSVHYKHTELIDDGGNNDVWVDDDDRWPSKHAPDLPANATDETRPETITIPNPNEASSIVLAPSDEIDSPLSGVGNAGQPRREQRQPPGVLPQDRYFPNRNPAPKRLGTHRGRLDRKRNLLDTADDEAFFGAFECPTATLSTDPSSSADEGDGFARSCQPTSYSPSSVALVGSPNGFSCGVLDPLYEQFSPPESQSQQEQQQQRCGAEGRSKPCSSPTCRACERKRGTMVVDGDDDPERWRELLPPSPERVPAWDPSRHWLCSDTVQL